MGFLPSYRSSFPQIHSYTTPDNLESFTTDAPVTKSGAAVTYGPYSNIPASTDKEFVQTHQKRVTVHYEYGSPILEVTRLERTAEISHWGANLNIQDNVWLHNAGPKYASPFDHLEWTNNSFPDSKDTSRALSFSLRTSSVVCQRIRLAPSRSIFLQVSVTYISMTSTEMFRRPGSVQRHLLPRELTATNSPYLRCALGTL